MDKDLQLTNSLSYGKPLFFSETSQTSTNQSLLDYLQNLQSLQNTNVITTTSNNINTETSDINTNTITTSIINILNNINFSNNFLIMNNTDFEASSTIPSSPDYILCSTNNNYALYLRVPYTYVRGTDFGNVSEYDYVPSGAEIDEQWLTITDSKFKVTGPFTQIKSDKTAFRDKVVTVGYIDRVELSNTSSFLGTVDDNPSNTSTCRGIDFEYTNIGSPSIVRLGFIGYSFARNKFVFYKNASYNVGGGLANENKITKNSPTDLNKFDLDHIYTNKIYASDDTTFDFIEVQSNDYLKLYSGGTITQPSTINSNSTYISSAADTQIFSNTGSILLQTGTNAIPSLTDGQIYLNSNGQSNVILNLDESMLFSITNSGTTYQEKIDNNGFSFGTDADNWIIINSDNLYSDNANYTIGKNTNYIDSVYTNNLFASTLKTTLDADDNEIQNVNVTSGVINSTKIGNLIPSSGSFTTLDTSDTTNIKGNLNLGVDGTSYDAIFYSDVVGKTLNWNASSAELNLTAKTLLNETNIDTTNGDFIVSGNNKINLSTSDNSINSISLVTNGGTSESILIQNTKGTSNDSINIVSQKGGITINSNSSTNVLNSIHVGTDGISSNSIFYSNSTGKTLEWNTAIPTLIINGNTGKTALDLASGNLAINTNKFTVDGASGDLAINTDKFTVDGASGDLAINTNKFTVDGTSGDLAISTNKFTVIGASGDLAINTDKFTVDGATGSIAINTDKFTVDGASGDLAINTNKFTIDGASGDLAINTNKFTVIGASGDLAINTNKFTVDGASGDLAINTNKFTVDGASGDLAINTNKFTVDGASGDLAINTNKFTVDGATGNTNIAGKTTLNETNIDTTNGDFIISGTNNINISTTTDSPNAIYLETNGGTSESIALYNNLGTADDSIYLRSFSGGIKTLSSKNTNISLFAKDSVNKSINIMSANIGSGNGLVTIMSDGTTSITSSYNNSKAVYLCASGGTDETIKIYSEYGTTPESIELTSDNGGIELNSATSLRFRNGNNGLTFTTSVSTVGTETLTSTKIIGGILIHSSAANDTITMPKASDLLSDLTNINVSDTLKVLCINSASANTLAIAKASDNSINVHGNTTIKASTSAVMYIRFTNIDTGTESADAYI